MGFPLGLYGLSSSRVALFRRSPDLARPASDVTAEWLPRAAGLKELDRKRPSPSSPRAGFGHARVPTCFATRRPLARASTFGGAGERSVSVAPLPAGRRRWGTARTIGSNDGIVRRSVLLRGVTPPSLRRARTSHSRGIRLYSQHTSGVVSSQPLARLMSPGLAGVCRARTKRVPRDVRRLTQSLF